SSRWARRPSGGRWGSWCSRGARGRGGTMDKAEPGGPRPYPPADFRRRAIARAIDLLIALAPIGLIPAGHPFAVALLAGALLLFGDSLFGAGRSLGKRL